MQFLRTALWVIIAVAIALFAKANWAIPPSDSGRVPIKLWADWVLLVRLPVLIVVAFLLGLLPMWLIARLGRWQIRKRLDVAEAQVSALQANRSAADGPLDDNADRPVAPL